MSEIADSQCIVVRGAKAHNLKNIHLKIPRYSLTVFTGPSGSGKSSLAFNTIFAEGQRRYVESLSAYARQFLEKMPPPDVDAVEGIPPAVSIEQKAGIKTASSTVGTSTEIYDYLKLFYARIGKTFSPVSGREVIQHSEKDVVGSFMKHGMNNTGLILIPVELSHGRDLAIQLEIYHSQGYGRLLVDDKILKFSEHFDISQIPPNSKVFLVIDRFIITPDDKELISRIADSAEVAFHEGNGRLFARIIDEEDVIVFHEEYSNNFESDGISFIIPDTNFFSFNNPHGACRTCEGYGTVLGIDENLVIPDKTLSVWEDAVVCWKGDKLSEWKQFFVRNSAGYNFPVHTPVCDLTDEQYKLLWNGRKGLYGIHDFFEYVEKNAYKIQYRVILSRYRGRTVCPECKGTRIRKETQYVKINGNSISDLVIMPIDELTTYFKNISLTDYELKVSSRILDEIIKRLNVLCNSGLGYLTLNRASNTLSGGEMQRIHLAQSVGSNLVGALYIIDEPTIGLHPKDTMRLYSVIRHLKELGNTVIIVEHEEEIIKRADYIVDLGPFAGSQGGEVVFTGTFQELLNNTQSLTSGYFRGELRINLPVTRRTWRDAIQITAAYEHNLQFIDVKFPLHILTVVSGPSGSGKTTLIRKILYPALLNHFGNMSEKPGRFKGLSGEFNRIKGVECIDQNPIGRSSRSNPATYTKAFDDIRTLFSNQPLSQKLGYKPGYFSFNTTGGRCETCKGDGFISVEMQFLADVELVCEDCGGLRYRESALEVKFHQKSVTDILSMTIDDTLAFFVEINTKQPQNILKAIIQKIQPLQEIGLGYLRMGQATSTLSGGEIQRLKLATYLVKSDYEQPILFIFDEPSTGLHYYDIQKLMNTFDKLIARGHSVIVIEHNMEIIKCADWVIDLGPDGGKNGGKVVFAGTPEDLCLSLESSTGSFLKEKLNK